MSPVEPCSSLVPPSVIEPVAHEPVPGVDATPADVSIALNNEGNNLDDANAKPPMMMHIITTCEARDRRIATKLTARWYEFWK